ncbi:MAG TPA: dihydropyrimidinase [Polyangia bacterium]
MLDLLVAGGTVVTEGGAMGADVGVEGGVIVALGRALGRARRTIDAGGRLVLPGAIDPHVHLQLHVSGTVSADDFLAGTRAAACGGVTTVIDFAEQKPGMGLAEAVAARRAEADPQVVVDYGLHCQVGDLARAEAELGAAVAAGVTSFKYFMLRKEGVLLGDADLYRLLRACGREGGLVTVHAENAALVESLGAELQARGDTGPAAFGRWRPPFVEAEAIGRALAIADGAFAPLYVVHVSTSEGAAAVLEARRRGIRAYGETCPQYFLLTEERLAGPKGHLFTCTPPLRSAYHSQGVGLALRDGWLQTVGSDHCPFPAREKAAAKRDFSRMPCGLPGVETLLPLVYTTFAVGRGGALSVERLAAITSANAARIFGLWPRKGAIRVGADADLVIFDPDRRVRLGPKALHSRIDYTPYAGRTALGWPTATIARGEVIVEEGELRARPGRGRFLARAPHGAALAV